MNAFADWLFTVLLGWTGRTANRLWSSIANGGSGFALALSKIWLPLLLIIVSVCTVIDIAIRLKDARMARMEKQYNLEHKKMRETMEHGEMSDEYREEMASFVTAETPPYVENSLFDEQNYTMIQFPQMMDSPDSFNAPNEQLFFEERQNMYDEPYIKGEAQNYYDAPQNADYSANAYNEYAAYSERPVRNRRADRRRQRNMLFPKNTANKETNPYDSYIDNEYKNR